MPMDFVRLGKNRKMGSLMSFLSAAFLTAFFTQTLERDDLVVVVRLAAVFFSYRAFLYQTYAAQLFDGLNHRISVSVA